VGGRREGEREREEWDGRRWFVVVNL